MFQDKFMKRAIEEAQKGAGLTAPNPLVGAVIVKGEEIISTGYHRMYGGDHAEQDALKHCDSNLQDAVLYVTLEPCNHHGKTPPCTEAIIRAGIKGVCIAVLDPNPIMSGKSVKILREKGIFVEIGMCEEEAKALNKGYFKWFSESRPYITAKYAMTVDGKIATSTGDSKWITSEESRHYAHEIRCENDAILVGVGTVIADNPELTVRHVPTKKQPIRIVLDPKGEIPLDSKVLDCTEAETIVFTETQVLQKHKIPVKTISLDPFSVENVVKALGKMGVRNLLVEGGATTHHSFMMAGLIDELHVFIAPKCLGGSGLSPMEGCGSHEMAHTFQFKFIEVKGFGPDIFLKGTRICSQD